MGESTFSFSSLCAFLFSLISIRLVIRTEGRKWARITNYYFAQFNFVFPSRKCVRLCARMFFCRVWPVQKKHRVNLAFWNKFQFSSHCWVLTHKPCSATDFWARKIKRQFFRVCFAANTKFTSYAYALPELLFRWWRAVTWYERQWRLCAQSTPPFNSKFPAK